MDNGWLDVIATLKAIEVSLLMLKARMCSESTKSNWNLRQINLGLRSTCKSFAVV